MTNPQRRPVEGEPNETREPAAEPRAGEFRTTAPGEPYPPVPDEGGHVELEAVQARQGTTLGQTRYILFASLLTIAVIFLILWLVIARL